MNQEIKEKWVEALRSGEYKQGKGALRTIDDKFCCLGVLCMLYTKEHSDIEWVTVQYDKRSYSFLGSNYLLPHEVQKWSGIDSHLGKFTENKINNSLSSLNDHEELTFSEIAEVIEKKF